MATANLPQQMTSEPEGDYEVFRNVPVFDEHVGDDGVQYDKRLLECIARNNNYRIDDTGDFCPIVAGHTPGGEGGEQPEIVGYAGPFKVSVIGNKDPRACIFCDFRVHKDHADTFSRNPRRSVELWPEESPEKRFFDPIAILGAETPKRALGMTRYRAQSRAKQPIRYEMGAEAGGSNTFIPDAGKKKKPQTFKQEGSDMMTPDEMAQYTAAMKPMFQAMIDDSLNAILKNDAAEQAGNDIMPTDSDSIGGMSTEALPEPSPTALPTDEALPATVPPAMDDIGDPAAPVMEEDEEPSPFAKYAQGKIDKYMCDDESEHKTDAMEYAMKFAHGLDDDDRAELNNMLKGGGDEGSKDFYAKMQYAMNDGDEDMTHGKPKSPSKGDDKDYGAEEKPDITQRYQKVRAANRKLEARNVELETEARDANSKAKYAKRSQTLETLSREFIMQEDEIDHCADMTDSQFDAHVDRIPQNYQKVVGPQLAGFASAPDRRPADTQDDQFSQVAMEGVEKYRKTHPGREITFKQMFKHVKDNDGKCDLEALAAK